MGREKLEQSLGLGATPSVIPAGDVDIRGDPRPVEIGWHPVAGLAGKWFAEQTGLGRLITDGIHKFPDPTQHWAVLVGDYCHQLWMVRDNDDDDNDDDPPRRPRPLAGPGMPPTDQPADPA